MLAVLCPNLDGGRRRLLDDRDIVAMTRTSTEVVLTVACRCGEFHEHRIPRTSRAVPASAVRPAVPTSC